MGKKKPDPKKHKDIVVPDKDKKATDGESFLDNLDAIVKNTSKKKNG